MCRLLLSMEETMVAHKGAQFLLDGRADTPSTVS